MNTGKIFKKKNLNIQNLETHKNYRHICSQWQRKKNTQQISIWTCWMTESEWMIEFNEKRIRKVKKKICIHMYKCAFGL